MKEKEIYRFLSENMLDVISLHHITGRIIYISPSVKHLLGYKPDDLNGNIWLRYTHREDKVQIINFFKKIKRARRNQRIKFECRLLHHNGSYIWLECVGKKLLDRKKQITGYEFVSRDISDRKKAEQQIIQSLEKEKSLHEMKSNFISMASHEFKTPLAAISTAVDLLETKLQMDELMTPFYQRNISRISAEIFILNTMLDEILTISRIVSNNMEVKKQPVRVEQVINDIKYQYFSERKDDRVLDVTVSGSPREIYADKNQLSKIFTNLVGNAFKFSSKKNPSVKLSYQKRRLVVRVKDDGVGIPAQDIPHLFTSFYRGSNVDSIEGTGLGLSIVKTFVESNNGTITVKSEEHKGTTFILAFSYPSINTSSVNT